MTNLEQIIVNENALDRWEDGVEHHPKSEELMAFLSEIDLKVYGDYFCWKSGGDGDNGETLMYQMDAFFEAKDRGDL
jgi:hypothetical protein